MEGMGYPNTKEGAAALLAAVGGRPTRWRWGLLSGVTITATAIGYCRYNDSYHIFMMCKEKPSSWTRQEWLAAARLEDRYILPEIPDDGRDHYVNLRPDRLLEEPIDPFRYPPSYYPHSCPTCTAPAYIGAIHHIACSSAACVHAERS